MGYSLNSTDSSFFMIEDFEPRCIWASYFIFIFLSSIIGDSIILVASSKYKAIRLQKLIVVAIQQIACCDLTVSLTVVLPKFTSLIANGWVLGDFWVCYFACCACYILSITGILNICIMLGLKLLLLKFPLRAKCWNVKKISLISAIFTLLAGIVPISLIAKDTHDVFFDYRVYACNFNFSTPFTETVRQVTSFICLSLPSGFVVFSTVWLLMIARRITKRSYGNMKWQGILTAVGVATAFLISFVPYTVYHFLSAQFDNDPKSIFHRIADGCLYLNTISNFYIYSLTIPSFKQFLLSKTKQILPFLEYSTVQTQLETTSRSESHGAVVAEQSTERI